MLLAQFSLEIEKRDDCLLSCILSEKKGICGHQYITDSKFSLFFDLVFISSKSEAINNSDSLSRSYPTRPEFHLTKYITVSSLE